MLALACACGVLLGGICRRAYYTFGQRMKVKCGLPIVKLDRSVTHNTASFAHIFLLDGWWKAPRRLCKTRRCNATSWTVVHECHIRREWALWVVLGLMFHVLFVMSGMTHVSC
jgi:hypothetical protein